MEVSILPKNILRIKSKQATFLVDATEKLTGINAMLSLQTLTSDLEEEGVVIIDGPGDFEIGGVKISGLRSNTEIVYSLVLDGVDLMLGTVAALEKIQHKVKEHALVVLKADENSPLDAAFVTGLATNVLVAYGPKGKTLIDSFGKENPQTLNKYSVTKDKLPLEVQTILLE